MSPGIRIKVKRERMKNISPLP
ncbi:hypothetical protein PANT111_160330 [Pantoea brenneri]|uniref:Uncharacterized protein n=1 Tax=Pantoea brenneri TaxID=472694 RepID=A0AAX3J514_9GAMM|nr:hypothetical protein PANT111_160330 [Pantoea brenneri]